MCLDITGAKKTYTYEKSPVQRYIESLLVQPIADRVAQNLEIISKKFQFSTRRTRILTGYIISTMLLLGTNRKSHRQNSSLLKSFQNNLKILCQPISNRLYNKIGIVALAEVCAYI